MFGFIMFSDIPKDLSAAEIYVQLLDTTYADAPSIKQSELILSNLNAPMTEKGISFRLPEAQLENSHRYEVWVHVDMDRSGDITAGDYLSTSSYAVPTRSGEVEILVEVNRIQG